MGMPKRWEDMSLEERVENLKESVDQLRHALNAVSQTLGRKIDGVSDAVSGAIHDLEARIKKLEGPK
jgi:archaellum component FlaC